MAQTSGAGLVSSVFGSASSAAQGDAASAQATVPNALACVVPYSTLLAALLEKVDALVPYAPDLRVARRRLWAWQNPATGEPSPTAAELARRIARVDLAWVATVQVEPALLALTAWTREDAFLPPFRVSLGSIAVQARQAYARAVLEALARGNLDVVAAWRDRGDSLAHSLPTTVEETYLTSPLGLEFQIGELSEQVTDLITLRNQRGADALASRDADVQIGIPMTPAGGPWFLESRLRTGLTALRGYSFADRHARYVEYSLLLQTVSLTVRVLGLREQLSWSADQTWFPSDAGSHVPTYLAQLAVPLTHLEAAFAALKLNQYDDATDRLRLALRATTAVTSDQDFKDDLESVKTILTWQQRAKLLGAVVAIGVATALTSGMVGALTELALTSVIEGGTLAGQVVLAAGTLATTAVWEVMISRTGTELMLGPEAVAGSSFAEDLAWQVVQTLVLRFVLYGFGDVLERIKKIGPKLETSARFSIEQVSMAGFAEGQHLWRTGELRTNEQRLESVVHQLVTAGVIGAGKLVADSFITRLGTSVDALTVQQRQDLDAVDVDRAGAKADYEKVRNGQASDAEVEAFLRRAADVWNRAVGVVSGMTPGADRDNAMLVLGAAKADVELRLAELGFDANLTMPDVMPSFRALMPGIIAVADDARPVLDTAYPPAQRPKTLVPGAEAARLPSGRTILLLPAGDVPPLPPPVFGPGDVPEAHAVPDENGQSSLDEDAADGLARLSGLSDARREELLDYAGTENRQAFLALLAHPEYPSAGSVMNAMRYLHRVAASPEITTYGQLWGPRLMARMLGLGDRATFWNCLRRTDEMLRDAPEADRAALITQFMNTSDSKLRVLVGDKPPPEPRLRLPSAKKLGIDVDGVEFERVFLPRAVQKYSTLSDQQQRAIASTMQARDSARKNVFGGLKPAAKLAAFLAYAKLQVDAGLTATRELRIGANNRNGIFAQLLFLRGLGLQLESRWFDGNPDVGGGSRLDGYKLVGDVHLYAELKSDDISLESDALQAARDYLKDANLDAPNLAKPPAKRAYYLWFIRSPIDPAVQAKMRAIVLAPGSPVTDVFIGPEAPLPLRP